MKSKEGTEKQNRQELHKISKVMEKENDVPADEKDYAKEENKAKEKLMGSKLSTSKARLKK